MNYSLLTTARNEERYIIKTLQSVCAQTILPREWVIIDDGSVDQTARLVSEYVKKYNWIRLIILKDFRSDLKTTGGRVGHLLNIAYKHLQLSTDIITKLDGDTEFNEDFFEQLLSQFVSNPGLGIASGNLVFEGKIEKVDFESTTRGAVMMIRGSVFDQIGGFYESKGRGEDTLFAVAARFYGWQTRTFPVYFNHLKPESKRHSAFHEAYVTGFYKGSIPYRRDYFLLTQIKYIFRSPIIIGSFIQLVGYIFSRYIIRYQPFPDLVRQQLIKEQKIGLLQFKFTKKGD